MEDGSNGGKKNVATVNSISVSQAGRRNRGDFSPNTTDFRRGPIQDFRGPACYDGPEDRGV